LRFLGLSLLQNRYPALHGLRFVAIVSVLQVHVTVTLHGFKLMPNGDLAALSQSVWFGMDLFFVLSGFLIGSMLLHQGGTGMGRFWLRRAFRTFPLYYFVLTALVLRAERRTWSTTSLLGEYFYLTNYMDRPREVMMSWGWSLCVEEHFYLLVPFLVFGLLRLRSARTQLFALLGLWSLGLGSRLLVIALHGPFTAYSLATSLYVPTHTRFDTLVAGLVLAHLCHHHDAALRALFARRAVRVGAWAVVALCLSYLLLPAALRPDVRIWSALAWGTVTSVMWVSLVLLLLFHEGALSRFLGKRPFLWAATLGYGVYLVHIPLMVWVVTPVAARLLIRQRWSLVPTWWASLGLLVAVSLAVAYVLHLVVEKPMLALRDRVAP